jgi:hypothetical protein
MEPRKVIRFPRSRTYRREQQVELYDEEQLLKKEQRMDLIKFLGVVSFFLFLGFCVLSFAVRISMMLP